MVMAMAMVMVIVMVMLMILLMMMVVVVVVMVMVIHKSHLLVRLQFPESCKKIIGCPCGITRFRDECMLIKGRSEQTIVDNTQFAHPRKLRDK